MLSVSNGAGLHAVLPPKRTEIVIVGLQCIRVAGLQLAIGRVVIDCRGKVQEFFFETDPTRPHYGALRQRAHRFI